MNKFIFSIALTIFLCINNTAHSQISLQEVVYLKNGSMIRGTVIEQIPNQSLRIQTADGSIFVYSMSEVVKITKEKPVKSKQISPFNQEKIGYRGFVDFGYTQGLGDSGVNRIELSTSHGRQFNPYFFTGVGIGLHYYLRERNMWQDEDKVPYFPLFIDLRGNLMNGPIIPFIGLKGGYSFKIDDDSFLGSGLYAAPFVGVKYGLSESFAMNLSLGYSFQQDTDDDANISGISIKLGLEF